MKRTKHYAEFSDGVVIACWGRAQFRRAVAVACRYGSVKVIHFWHQMEEFVR